jgi:hypothetical protein
MTVILIISLIGIAASDQLSGGRRVNFHIKKYIETEEIYS